MKTHTLKIMHDTNSENPWTSWDTLPPLFTEGWRDYGDTEYNLSVSILIDLIPLSKLNKNILELFNLDKEENYPITRQDYTKKSDFVIDSLHRHVDNTVENIETLASYLKLPYYSWNSRGYSQGDSIDCILVVTPEYAKTAGINRKKFANVSDDKETIKLLKEDSKLFDAYAWWDVYWYELVEHIPLTRPDGTISTETEENIIDSCWWFYGDDWLEQIKSELPDEHQHLFDDARKNIQ